MEKNEIIPIKHFLDALRVRKIRNECRLFMTNNTSKIGFVQQLFWYYRIYKRENKNGEMTCFLFSLNNRNIGFGFVRKKSNRYWITGGLKSVERGKGLGKILFSKLVEKVFSDEVWLEVLETNVIAKKIYKELGFTKKREFNRGNKKIVEMRLRIKSRKAVNENAL